MAAEIKHTPSDWQNKWIHRFSNIEDSVKQEETLTEFIEEAKSAPQGPEATNTQTRNEPQTRRPRQFPQRQRKQHRRQAKKYNAAAASRIQKLYRRSRAHAIREVTEAEPSFCKIPSDELFYHFSRTFQQKQPSAHSIPMEIPPFAECSSEDHNTFAEEFTPEEVWTRLQRCGNTSPGPDGIR
jgi:hypothetical protein